MPTYEYECSRCGHSFELFQGIKDPPAKRCPKCRCAVRRVPSSGAGIIFKGSGFYQTDYRSKSYKEAATKDSGAADKPSSDSTPAKPSKPESGKPGSNRKS
jgi:putative FmdB family regulatory protein